ncbi:MAG TPA: outer membrane beta-barrel protein, partial [Bacteroidia bacterium]|nr:outer membrane beta-barrel protein [Bacteroidia bacterium]
LNYLVGIVAQPTLLKGQDLSRNISTEKRSFNLIPTARLSLNISKHRKLTAAYRGRASQPGFTQLQPITNNSNPQNTVIGNPDLKPEFNNRFEVKYKQSGRGSGYTIFSKVDLQHTQNKIVTSRVIIPDSLKQQTTYLNANGFYTASGYYSITKPIAGPRFTLTWYGGGNYSRNIAFNNNERNIGKTMGFNQGVKLGMDIEDVVDARLNIAYSANKTRYSLASYEDRRTSRIFLGVEGRNYFRDNWVVGYNFSQIINNGYNTGNLNPTLLNMYLEYQFLKGNKARLRVQGFDLLNENTSIRRDVFDNQIVDSRTNRLGRYFLLSLEFRLDKFGTG